MNYLVFKRFCDFFAAAFLLLCFSPVLLLVAFAIRFESRGPIFYSSKRIGKNFRVFEFYKFRSMRIDADKMLQKVAETHNQYVQERTVVEVGNGIQLMSDEGWVEEQEILSESAAKEASAFVKIPNDPRVTKVGFFLRNTSLDELPQLVNVLKGDMSLVGIRPIPLYEAVELTSDEAIARFSAPAGITGYWQVTERGTSSTTTSKRKELDNFYAKHISFFLDVKILLKTPFAAFQREKV